MGSSPPFLPFRSLGAFTRFMLSGRLHFPRYNVGRLLPLEDGCDWRIFREAVLAPLPGHPAQPAAIFRVRFHVSGMSPAWNIRFSLLPIPFFTSLPGFRHKLWLIQPESGDFQGIYEWDELADAEAYAQSFAMRFMTRRSLPGSVSCQVLQRGAINSERTAFLPLLLS